MKKIIYILIPLAIIIILLSLLFYKIYYNKFESFYYDNINIVLTCINNFQDYILININQLIKLGHKKIYIVTNNKFFHLFDEYKNSIILIDCDNLPKTYQHVISDSTDFWHLTSSRFMYIYELMNRYNLENIVHLENDVLTYYNCNILLENLDNNMYIPFDSFHRNIASIVYIPNKTIYKKILDNYDFTKNDMENFSIIKEKTNLIKQFPIIKNDLVIQDINIDEYNFVSTNFDKFQYIFDAAAIGQYLGGVDPKNDPNDTIGFVNETCIIKYDKYKFEWIIIDNIKKPFIIINNEKYPIFNLHIHSKKLENFV